jgi:TonB family protein
VDGGIIVDGGITADLGIIVEERPFRAASAILFLICHSEPSAVALAAMRTSEESAVVSSVVNLLVHSPTVPNLKLTCAHESLYPRLFHTKYFQPRPLHPLYSLKTFSRAAFDVQPCLQPADSSRMISSCGGSLMSAAPKLALAEASREASKQTPKRVFPRHPINVPVDVIVLRSGVPENLPGRATDISESGVGAVIAGEMSPGQHVAVELRLPNVGVPVRARALVRYQSRLHCGLEFSTLSVEQREMIRYWIYRATSEPIDWNQIASANISNKTAAAAPTADPQPMPIASTQTLHSARKRKLRIGRRSLYLLIVGLLALAALAWWQWQRSWNELESHAQAAELLRVSPETMDKRIVTKLDPFYPEAARTAGIEGLVVLDAVIAPDGGVQSLRPISGAPLLVRSATDAVWSWKFEPYLSDGRPVAVETTIALEFRLQ